MQMGVFSGGEWWTEGHVDYGNAAQALHCLRLQQLCAELKKSKAVFTPHLPGWWIICVHVYTHVGRSPYFMDVYPTAPQPHYHTMDI